jgi:hypothetical protein
VEGGAYLVIALFFGIAGGVVGKLKGSSFWLWALISGIIPVFGLLAAVFYRIESDELRKQCPRCGKVVMLYDALCMRCGNELDFPDTAIEPESVAKARSG